MSKDYYVYILECANGKLYTGYTVDLEKRFNKHISGKNGAKFTRAFKPRKIAGSWKITGERGDAMHVEAFIKSMTRDEKISIVTSPQLLIERLISSEDVQYDIDIFKL